MSAGLTLLVRGRRALFKSCQDEKNRVPRRLGGAAGEGRVKEMAKYGEIGLKGSYRFLNEGFLSQLPKVGASLPKAHNTPPKLRGRAQTPSASARGPRARGGWR